jgi:hypothetical protein
MPKAVLQRRLRINEASEEEIRELWGIGPARAARIVQDREANGFFRGPDELSRVIAPDLARAVSHHIDWRVPREGTSFAGLGERDLFGALLSLGGVAVGIWVFLTAFERAADRFDSARSFGLEAVNGWRSGSVAAVGAVVVAIGLSGVLVCLVRSQRWERFAIRASFACFVLLLLPLASLAVSNAVYYQEYAPGGWHDLVNDNAATAALALQVSGALVSIAPAVLVYWRPALIESRALRIAVDVGWLVYTPVLTYAAWTLRDTIPTWALVLLGIQGALAALVGVLVVTREQSALDISLAALVSTVRDANADRHRELIEWINARMPDEAQQKRLGEALNRKFPGSRRLIVAGSLIGALGGAAVAGAVKGLVQGLGLF